MKGMLRPAGLAGATVALVGGLLVTDVPPLSAAPAPEIPPVASESWCAGDLTQLAARLRASGFTAQAAHNLSEVTRIELLDDLTRPDPTCARPVLRLPGRRLSERHLPMITKVCPS